VAVREQSAHAELVADGLERPPDGDHRADRRTGPGHDVDGQDRAREQDRREAQQGERQRRL